MKLFVLTLLILGSVSSFAAVGEDRASVHDGVMCQEEGVKATTSNEESEGSDASEALNG